MRPVFADPKTDLVFKRIFGRKAHKRLLVGFLNDLLDLPPERRIVDLEYLTPEQLPPLPVQKRSIVDVKCVDAQGTRYIVEMQVLTVEAFEKRLVYNASKDYAGQLARGDLYPQLNDVVLVAICNFHLWWHEEMQPGAVKVPMVSRFSISEEKTGARRLQQVRYVVMELPKYEAGEHPQSTQDKWAFFFRETDRLKEVPQELSEGPFREALEVARVSGFTEEEWEEYDRELMAEQDARGAITMAEKMGYWEGHDSGRKQGRKEGRKEGQKEGQQAMAQALLDILLARGFAVPEAVRARILATADLELLRQWMAQAAVASSLDFL